MRRLGLFAPGEYYHLLARGNYKQKIFLDEDDYIRFLFLILYSQLIESIPHIGRTVDLFKKHKLHKDDSHHGQHPVLTAIEDKIAKRRLVELSGFCLMPNHFHLIIKEVEEGGISRYMQKILNGFTKYHNTKREKKGHLFEGPFKAVHVKTDGQLLYLSAYVHRNPREFKKWKDKEIEYMWSSYQDHAIGNRWGQLLTCDMISGDFKSGEEYMKAVEDSGAKEELEDVLEEVFPDKWFE